MSILNQINSRIRANLSPSSKLAQTLQNKSVGGAYVMKIIAEFKDRQRAEIQKWRQALEAATHPEDQKLYPLQDLYDNLSADGHYISQVEIRKAATLCNSFSIIDTRTGKEQPEKSAFFRKQWFYDFMENALDSITRGYTLIELTDISPLRFKIIPRRNLIPSKKQLLLSVSEGKGLDYTATLGRTLIEVGDVEDLGLMAHLCGLLIWKRNAMQAWAEYSERFGMPLITATTTKNNDAEMSRIQKMLRALGEGAQAILPEGTTIDIKQAATGDSYNVYDKQIERINTEISKPVCGGTMVSDNGSSRSQSEVHERNLDDKIAARDRRIITFVTNDQLIPILQRIGYPFNPQTDQFIFDQTYELTLKEHWEIVDSALNRYKVPAEWVSKTFNIPIEGEREMPQTAPTMRLSTPQGKTLFSENFQ